jgi:D-inositol-3-phosphate glycosyltransferase
MSPKRILIISYHTCPLASEEGKETGGMNVYVLELSKQLALMGHHVDVITRSQDPNIDKIVQVAPNFQVIHLQGGPESPMPKKSLIKFIPEFVESFKKLTQKENLTYDIYHAHYYLSGLIGLELNNLKPHQPIPMIMTFHTLALMKNLVARNPTEVESRIRIEAEYSLVEKCAAIITPSASDKQYLKYLYQADENKVFEIPPGVNTALFKPMDRTQAKNHIHAEKDTKIILYVGRIEPLKGIDVLLYALKILVAQKLSIPICLLIIGGDISQHITQWSPLLKQLEELRHTLRISSQVNFIGQQPQHELPFYYNSADLVVMPSHYESFGMAAAEAMACGVPVITTNVTGISNLIDEQRSTLVTTVNNPLLLASQIKRILTDAKLANQIRQDNIANVSDLSWENVTQQIESVYNKFIK